MSDYFQQLYASMDSDALIDLQRKGGLRPEAEEILIAVLEARGVTAPQRSAIAAELEATSYEDQVKHLAPIGSRIMARLIDTVLAVGIAVAAGWIVLEVSVTQDKPMLLLLIPGGFLAYLLFTDAMPGGQSLGKRWNQIAVVDIKTHAPCTAWQSLVRNFFLATVGVLDFALVQGHQGQRIGDRLAGTHVVKAEYLGKPPL